MSETRTDEDLDIELFIEEVKKYPAIWNVAVEEYHDRQKKRSGWTNICRIFFYTFEEKDDREKNEICNKLIKKWKNIKDNFLRSEKKRTKSGQGADTSRRYIYANQLSFLIQTRVSTETQSSLRDTDEDVSQEEVEEVRREDLGPSSQYTVKPKKRKHDLEAALVDFIKAPIPSQPAALPESNADKSFFDSLIPSINNFTEDQKLEFRCEVLNIIKRMRRENRGVSASSGQPDYSRYPTIRPSVASPMYLHSPQYRHLTYAHYPLSSPGRLTPSPGRVTTAPAHTPTPSTNIPITSPSNSSIYSETQSNIEDECYDIFRNVELE